MRYCTSGGRPSSEAAAASAVRLASANIKRTFSLPTSARAVPLAQHLTPPFSVRAAQLAFIPEQLEPLLTNVID